MVHDMYSTDSTQATSSTAAVVVDHAEYAASTRQHESGLTKSGIYLSALKNLAHEVGMICR